MSCAFEFVVDFLRFFTLNLQHAVHLFIVLALQVIVFFSQTTDNCLQLGDMGCLSLELPNQSLNFLF